MEKTIPTDSTIATVWDDLIEPRQYVSRVWGLLRKCARAHGNAYVKIGITGTGKYPAFRILRIDGSGTEVHDGAYYDSGAPMPDADPKSANWSSASMSYEDVDAFFREKTKWISKVG